jgi:hypothetical protein
MTDLNDGQLTAILFPIPDSRKCPTQPSSETPHRTPLRNSPIRVSHTCPTMSRSRFTHV